MGLVVILVDVDQNNDVANTEEAANYIKGALVIVADDRCLECRNVLLIRNRSSEKTLRRWKPG